jgi:hypothetical protein
VCAYTAPSDATNMCSTTEPLAEKPHTKDGPQSLQKRTRSRQQRVAESDSVPPAKLIGVSSFSSSTSSKWKDAYVPPPVINQSTILAIGFFLFVLASLWPPLILLFAYVASKLVPYSFRVNDDATTRRQLFAEFSREDDLPEEFKHVPSHVKLEESYWVNGR